MKSAAGTIALSLDFPYLALAIFGLLKIVNAFPTTIDRVESLDAIGMVLLALAIAIRLAKAIIEVVFHDWY